MSIEFEMRLPCNLGLNKPIVIVLDNARYEKCKLLQNYATSVGIQLCYLSCYSPQLNLIERFWKFIRALLNQGMI
ncbi:MAG: transposase [Richelia sp.]|nr:transposase [Richelia sp.]